MKPISRTYQMIYQIVRIFLGVLFIAASWEKIVQPEAFATIIENYKILPAILVNATAYILPWIEMICGALLIIGIYVKGSTLIVSAMMIVFISLLIVSQIRGLDITCGCFSLSLETSKSMYYYIVRDLAILGAGLWVLTYKIRIDKAQMV